MAIRIAALPAAGPGLQRSLVRLRSPRAVPGLGLGLNLSMDLVALSTAALCFAPDLRTGLWLVGLSLAVLLVSGRYGTARQAGLGASWALLTTAGVAPAVGLSLLGGTASADLRQGALAAALMSAGTGASGWVGRLRRSRGRHLRRTLIIGAGRVGHDISSILGTHPEYGMLPVGFVDDVEDGADLPLPHLGSVRSLPTVVLEHMITDVVVAYGPGRDEALVPAIRACQEAGVAVRVVPRFYEFGLESSPEEVWGLPLAALRPPAPRQPGWTAKRLLDVTVSAVALALLAPLLGTLALAVKLSSPGPILFRQERVGRGGRPIHVLKFRSMTINSDSDVTWDVARDSRVTSVGRILRKTSLDELPQLFNILRGDMSLVGPRPERPHFAEQFSTEIHSYAERHRVPVGLTGLAQVHGLRGDTSITERARFDNRYIEAWSLSQDLAILVRTIPSVLRHARRGG